MKMRGLLILITSLTFAVYFGCSGNSGNGSGESDGGPDGSDLDTDGDADGDSDADGPTCGNVSSEGSLTARPVDIIISIDNSSSMDEEIEAVQERINTDLAAILTASAIDYRVILVSRYGYVGDSVNDSDNPVCIGTPLGAADCPSSSEIPNLVFPPISPPVPQTVRFFHHSTDIRSSDMWCKLLTSLDSPDEEKCSNPDITPPPDPPDNPKYCVINSDFPNTNLRVINDAPWNQLFLNGWKEYLRSGSYKVFVAITDDEPAGNECTDYRAMGETLDLGDDDTGASNFDRLLRLKAPEHFGANDGDRNYTWHSIVGFSQGEETNTATPTDRAVEPEEPIMNDYECEAIVSSGDNDSTGVGEGYQHLSKMTGGLRYPSCLTDNFDAIFNAIAQEVIDIAIVPCVFAIPDVSETTGAIDYNDVQVDYERGSDGLITPLTRSPGDNPDNCTANGFYYDDSDNPTQILLCEDTCDTVQADEEAKINIDFGCLAILE